MSAERPVNGELPKTPEQLLIRNEQDIVRDGQNFAFTFHDLTPDARTAYVLSRASSLNPNSRNKAFELFLGSAMKGDARFQEEFMGAVISGFKRAGDGVVINRETKRDPDYDEQLRIANLAHIFTLIPPRTVKRFGAEAGVEIIQSYWKPEWEEGAYQEKILWLKEDCDSDEEFDARSKKIERFSVKDALAHAKSEIDPRKPVIEYTNGDEKNNPYLVLAQVFQSRGQSMEAKQVGETESGRLITLRGSDRALEILDLLKQDQEFQSLVHATDSQAKRLELTAIAQPHIFTAQPDEQNRQIQARLASILRGQATTGIKQEDLYLKIKELVDRVDPAFAGEIPHFYDFDYTIPPWFDSEGSWRHKDFDNEYFYLPKGDTYKLDAQKPIENPYDLRNLRLIDPAEVIRCVKDLNNLKLDLLKNPDLKLLFAIATGGTIASIIEEERIVIGMDMSKIFDYVGRGIDKEWKAVTLSFPELIDSSQMDVNFNADMAIAISYVIKNLDPFVLSKLRGVLVAHGTDTMAPSGARLANMLGPNVPVPVGVTGSQAGMGNKLNEISGNVYNTLLVLDRMYEEDLQSVFMYMGGDSGYAYLPTGAVKASDTKKREAFKAESSPVIIEADDVSKSETPLVLPFARRVKAVRNRNLDPFQPTIFRGPLNSRTYDAQMDYPRSEIERMVGVYADEVDMVIAKTYGTFTFPRRQADSLMKAANERDMLVFATSPFALGKIGRYVDALYLIKKGAVPSEMLTHALVAKGMLASCWYSSREAQLAFLLSNNYIGEQPEVIDKGVTWEPRHSLAETVRMGVSVQLGQPRESIPSRILEVFPPLSA